MEQGKKDSYLFWGLGAAALGTLVASAYYMYTSLSQDEELPEEQKSRLFEIKEELDQNEADMTPGIAVRIMALINKHGDDHYKIQRPDIEEKRRAAINNEQEYQKVCEEYFTAKQTYMEEAANNILSELGVSFEQVQKSMAGFGDPMTMEKELMKYDIPVFEGEKPSPDTVKEAFKYFGKKLEEGMQEVQKIAASGKMQNEMDQYLFMKILISKTQTDDHVYLRYQMTEQQIKYLLHEYKLIDDPEIKAIYQRLSRIESMMG